MEDLQKLREAYLDAQEKYREAKRKYEIAQDDWDKAGDRRNMARRALDDAIHKSYYVDPNEVKYTL